MSAQRGAQACDQGVLRSLGRGPLQQVPAAHGLPVHGAHHGIAQQQRLLRQQGQVPHTTGQGPQQVARCFVHKTHADQPKTAGHPARKCPHQGRSRIGRNHQRQRAGQGQAQARQGQHHQHQRCGRHERAAQVVQQLPAVDGRKAPALGLGQKGPQLPVAPRPAVQAGGCGVTVFGLRLHQRHIADHGAACQRTFEQVVAQHLVGRQAPAQHGVHRGHMQQALAGEAAFGKKILVDVGRHGAVRVQPLLARKQPLPQRGGGSGGQWRQHPGLQDAVALYHALACGIQPGLVLGVLGHPHQAAQAARGQLRIAVEREHIAGLGRQVREFAQVQEGALPASGEGRHQLFELAALALPADPLLLRGAVGAGAVQQQKPRGTARDRRVLGIQAQHQALGMGQQHAIFGQVLHIGIHTVGQQRKLRKGLGVGQVMQVQAVHQPVDGAGAAEQGRDSHQHTCRYRNARWQQVAGHVGRPDGFANEPVDHGHHDLGHGQQQQDGDQRQARKMGCAGIGPRLHTPQGRHQPGQQTERAQQQGAQVQRHTRQAHRRPPQGHRVGGMSAHTQGMLQLVAPGALQPIACQGLRSSRMIWRLAVGTRHQHQQRLRHGGLALPAAGRQVFDAVQGGVAGGLVFGREHGRLQHGAQHQAGLADDVGPVGRAHPPQCRDGIAHAQLVGGLVDLLLGLQRHQVGHSGQQPLLYGRWRACSGMPAHHAAPHHRLRQVGQEHRCHATLLHGCAGGIQRQHVQVLAAGGAQAGQLLRGLVAGQALGQAAQVLHQHHTQRGGQRPQLALAQLAGLLVGVEVMHQQRFIKRAVGMGHKRPRHTVHTRQAHQRGVFEHRQRAVVTRWQPGPDLLELAFDQVEVVKQPFSGGADGMLVMRCIEQVAVCGPQRADVALQAWVKGGAAKRCLACVVGRAQVPAMLFEAGHAKHFGPQGVQHQACPGIEHAVQRGRNPGPWCA